MSNPFTLFMPRKLFPLETQINGKKTGIREISFLNFILQEKVNRIYCRIALVGTLTQFVIFKLLYPFPDFFSDSYSYIFAASAHLDVSTWPIGYSKFLAAFHQLTHSDTALVAFQYILLELTAMYFYFTVLYFYRPRKGPQIIIFLFLFFNPLFLYLCNYVSSDPLFTALSLWWFTELTWIINRPRLYQVFTQGILLFLAFTIRNSAYIYPFIAVGAFLLSRQRTRVKLAGCLLGPLLILPFVLHTRMVAREMTGTAQFSLFTGWQLANNALYFRGWVSVDSTLLPTPESRELDRISKKFFLHVRPEAYRSLAVAYGGNYFIIQPEGPLKQYVAAHFRATGIDYGTIVAWGKASAVFEPYGSYLLRTYPLEFAYHFILPNIRNYFLPPLEKLERYNLGWNDVFPDAKSWFDYKSDRVTSISTGAQGVILFLFPALFLLVNLNFIVGGLHFIFRTKYLEVEPAITRTILLVAFFLALNFCFSIFATIVVFRYEIFPMIICLAFSLFIYNYNKRTFNIESL